MTIPACEPVSEIASWPRSWIAIAASAHEMRSPTEMSMSSSRGSGRSETSCARSSSSSVVSPIAERTPTTRLPVLARGDEPARDVLELLGVGDRGAAELHHDRADACGASLVPLATARDGLVVGRIVDASGLHISRPA